MRGVRNGQVIAGNGTSTVRFGGKTPLAITIQLLRWELTEDGIVKQTRDFHMPQTFVLNQRTYARTVTAQAENPGSYR